MTTLTIRRDRFHRYWPWGLVALIVAITFATEDVVSSLLLAAALGPLAFGLSWLFHREQLIITETSIVQKGWILASTVNFADIVEHELELDEDSFGLSGAGVGEFFLSLLAQFTVRPVRWISRRIVHRDQPDAFYRGVLRLYGYERELLLEIEASHGWVDILAVFSRITHQLETGPSPVPQARIVQR